MLFRVGDVAAMIAIVLFALTPAIRYTNHGLRQVPPALIEAATMSGCTPRQLLWKVQFPLALPEIMLGINQVILMALAMNIISAMIGTRDLGQEVFIALAKANVGRGMLAGLAVAFIGIIADRLMGAWSKISERGSARSRNSPQRHRGTEKKEFLTRALCARRRASFLFPRIPTREREWAALESEACRRPLFPGRIEGDDGLSRGPAFPGRVSTIRFLLCASFSVPLW